jgi:hypothetical protein
MVKNAQLMLVVLLTLVLTGAAWASDFGALNVQVDCEGWSIEGSLVLDCESVYLGYGAWFIDGALTGTSFTDNILVFQSNPNFSVSGTWDPALCEYHWIRIALWFSCECQEYHEQLFDFCFTCDCNGDYCHYTPGYWKNHPGAWPVSSLTLGGVPYDKPELLAILHLPTVKDVRTILAHHLIAAKLNVAIGLDPVDAIGDADAYLATWGLLSGDIPRKGDKAPGVAALEALTAYNEYCPSTIPCDGMMLGTGMDQPRAFGNRQEKSTWGAIKSLYK